MIPCSNHKNYFISDIVLVALSLGLVILGNMSHAQGIEIKASIVPGAIAMGDKAYRPNPISIKIGNTVTWTNNDNIFHTVTSGLGSDDANLGKEFDSGLAGPTALITQGKTFSHTIVTGGEFPYFCQLHPTMIGKVIVTK
jgi:plastocyanin